MTMKNNYGSWLDSEVASPGVISFNKVRHEYLDEGICLDCEQIFFDIDEDETLSEEEKDEAKESVECFDHTMIFGDWKKDEASGEYVPDEDGEFAAVYTQGGFNDITVVWSKFTTRGTPCSPCAPGCCSIPDEGETGEFLCYTLPKYLLEEEE